MTAATTEYKQGVFVAVHVSRPSLRTQLTWEDLGLAAAEQVASPPTARPPTKEYERFAQIEGRLRRALLKHSVGGEEGFRFMRIEKYQDFETLYTQYRDEYLGLVEPFLATYEDARIEGLAAWRRVANDIADTQSLTGEAREALIDRVLGRLQDKWPHAEELRGRFAVDASVLYFELPDEQTIASMGSFGEALRERMRATMEGMLIRGQEDLRQRAIAVMTRLRDVLRDGARVSERSLKPLRAFAETFDALSVTDDSQLSTSIRELVNAIDHGGGAEGIRSSGQQWAAALDGLSETIAHAEQLVEQSAQRRGGLGQRRIAL